MRVCLIHLGSPASAVEELAVTLVRNGVDVDLVVRDLLRPSLRTAANVIDMTGGRGLADAVSAGRQLAADWAEGSAPDVVHAFGEAAGLMGATAARGRVPLVLSLGRLASVDQRRGSTDPRLPRRALLDRRLTTEAALVVTGCAEQSLDVLRLGLPHQRLRLVPAAVDPHLHRVTPLPRGRQLRLLHLDGFDAESGLDDVLAAVAAVPEVLLGVVGRPSHAVADGFRTTVRRLHLEPRVRVLGATHAGFRTAPYPSFDALVTAPRQRPWGRSILEAMASGRPVVAASVGAAADLVVDGVTGFLTAARGSDSLAGGIAELAGRPVEERSAMGATAWAHLTERHTWEHRVRVLLDAYDAGRALGPRAAQAIAA